MNLKFTSKLFLLTAATVAGQELQAQCSTMANAVADITLQCSTTLGTNNRSGVAYYPTENQYYSVNCGSSGYPIETFAGTGGNAIGTATQNADYRGFWYNPNLLQMEGNTYNSGGIFNQGINVQTGVANGVSANVGAATMPDMQSCGVYVLTTNQVIYYNSGVIYKYNRATGAFSSSVTITGLPSGNINSYGIGYTGVAGSEVCIYDYTNQRVNFVNFTTGAYVSFCQLPASAPIPSSYMMGYAHNRIFLFDAGLRRWYGYKVTSQPDLVFTSNNIHCNPLASPIIITGAVSYTWSTGATTASISVNPAVTTTYAVVASDISGCTSISNFVLTAATQPTVTASASPSLACGSVGNSTLTALGATNYTWSTGPTFNSTVSVSDGATTTYTVAGESTGCLAFATVTLYVESPPTITLSASNGTICSGLSATLTSLGANSFSWSGLPSPFSGSLIVVSPNASAVYTVVGLSPMGCAGTPQTLSLSVLASVPLTTSVSASSICTGQSVNLSATGANSYVWMPGNVNGSNISVAPLASTVYTVTGISNSNPCMVSTVSISVGPCVGLEENSANALQLAAWPNPNNGSFTLKGKTSTTLHLMNSLGQDLQTIRLTETNDYTIVVEDLADGIYFLTSETISGSKKIVVTK